MLEIPIPVEKRPKNSLIPAEMSMRRIFSVIGTLISMRFIAIMTIKNGMKKVIRSPVRTLDKHPIPLN